MKFKLKDLFIITTLLIYALFSKAESIPLIPNITLISEENYKYQIIERPFEAMFAPSDEHKYKSFKIPPSHGFIFQIPERYHSFSVDQLVLSHRQNSHTKYLESNKIDRTPGLTSILFLDQKYDQVEQWRFWPGMSSGKWGAKYAELRPESLPELELLYSFNYYGTKSLDDKISKKDLNPIQVSVVNVGKTSIFLHQIQIRYLPPAPTSYIEQLYSSQAEFDLFNYGRAKKFGGGEKYKGAYPKANRLKRNEKINIELPPNVKISAVDVICGDIRGWDYENNKYLPGNAFLNIKWIRNNVVLDNLLIDENVGAQSMLRGMPEKFDELTQEGDIIEISSSAKSANFLYIMGYRVGVREQQ